MRLQLHQDEIKEINEGRAAMHETSAPGFLTIGLHIESLQ